MKVKFNQQQIDFISKVAEKTEYKDIVSSFVENKEINLDDDIADELRELCADVEIYKLQSNIKDEEYKIACELVDLLYN